MKRFIISLLTFAVPMFLIVSFYEYKLASINNIYAEKKELFEKHLADCEILVLGSSHTLYGINPIYLSRKSFNMANVSQTLYFDHKIVEKYADRMPKLKTIIIPISHPTLETDFFDKKNAEYWRLFYYEKIYGITSPMNNYFDLRNYSYIALYGNTKSFFYAFKGSKPDPTCRISELGFVADAQKSDVTDEKKGLERLSTQVSIMSEKNRAKNIEYLTNIIVKCRTKGVRAILITTPVWHTYSDHVDPDKYEWMQKTLARICARNHIDYFNYFRDNRFVPADFANCDHLNAEGAKKLTGILERDMSEATPTGS